tara:strand:- start:97 stop:921 length:825 start_codon:yes stop_codon:yes gene_type:complete
MIIWIASYPKSGNTWIRSFLSYYLYSSGKNFSFDLLNNIGEFPDHHILKKFMDDNKFHDLAEVSKHWIKVQEFINLEKKNIFLKTHSAFCNINGNLFTDSRNTLAIIYVVRDPRNVILSMSNHFEITQEKCFEILANEKHIIYPKINKELIPSTLVGSWKNNYLSWKNCKTIKKIIIKYEDLVNNSNYMFKKIINFLCENTEIKFDEEKLVSSVNSTQFDNLRNLENKHGFNMGQKNKFFHLGKKNDWKDFLDKKIENKVKNQFKQEMNELGYI